MHFEHVFLSLLFCWIDLDTPSIGDFQAASYVRPLYFCFADGTAIAVCEGGVIPARGEGSWLNRCETGEPETWKFRAVKKATRLPISGCEPPVLLLSALLPVWEELAHPHLELTNALGRRHISRLSSTSHSACEYLIS